MIEPDINKIITDKYDKEKTWQIGKVIMVSLIADQTKKNSENWYEMIIHVRVHDDEKDKELLDSLRIRIDIPNMYTRDKYKERNSDMKVTLITYEPWR